MAQILYQPAHVGRFRIDFNRRRTQYPPSVHAFDNRWWSENSAPLSKILQIDDSACCQSSVFYPPLERIVVILSVGWPVWCRIKTAYVEGGRPGARKGIEGKFIRRVRHILKPDSQRWQQISEIYHAALGRNSASQRAFLDVVCLGDESLRREVESLLAQPCDVEGLLDAPAVEVEGKILDERAAAEMVACSGLAPWSLRNSLAEINEKTLVEWEAN